MRGEQQFKRAIYGSVLVFTLLSLLVGWWAASRVMSPVSELANRLKRSGPQQRTRSRWPRISRRRGRPARRGARRLRRAPDRSRAARPRVQRRRQPRIAHAAGGDQGRGRSCCCRARTSTTRRAARLRRIQRAEQQCTDLISALLLLSRNERGHGATDVARVAEQLLDAHRAQLGGKPLELRMEGERGLVVDAPEAAVVGRAGQPDRQRGEVHAWKARSSCAWPTMRSR